MVSWYSTHCVFIMRYSDLTQLEYTLLERVILVSAIDKEDAICKATEFIESENLRRGDRPFHWNTHKCKPEFLGVRKVLSIAVQEDSKVVNLNYGRELTSWEYIASESQISDLLNLNLSNIKLVE